jgi:AraC family transcriptional regulator
VMEERPCSPNNRPLDSFSTGAPPAMSSPEHAQFSNSTIDCRQSHYQPGVSLERHYHDTTWMVFAFSGSFALTMRSCETVLGSHSLLYLPAGEMHANVFGSHGAGVFITAIDPAWIGDRLEVVNADADRPRIAPAGYLRGLAHKMHEEFKSPDALSDLIVEGAFLELLGRWFRDGFLQHRDAPAWMRRVKALLQDSFRDPLSLKDVAQVAGVHPSHVAREFHRIYGMTVGDYIRKLRVDFVAEQLVQPHKRKKEDTVSLTDLALCAGFSSHAHMAAMFKRVTGMTPTEYRKSHGITSIR